MKVRRFKPISAFSGGQDPRNISSLTAYWDASNAANMTLTATRQVSQLNDLSGNNYHLTQATAGNQPYLSRSDNQENRVLYSDDLNASYWSLISGSVRSVATTSSPFGDIVGIIGDAVLGQKRYIIENAPALAIIAGTSYTFSIYAKKGNKDWGVIDIRFRNATGDFVNTVTAYFNLSTGAAGTTTGASSSIEAVPGFAGWYKISVAGTGNATTTKVFLTAGSTTADNTANMSGDATNINGYFAGAQFRVSSADPTYIPTTTYPQYRGINGQSALVFDGVDDYMSANTLASVFAGEDKPISIIAAVKHATVAGIS